VPIAVKELVDDVTTLCSVLAKAVFSVLEDIPPKCVISVLEYPSSQVFSLLEDIPPKCLFSVLEDIPP